MGNVHVVMQLTLYFFFVLLLHLVLFDCVMYIKLRKFSSLDKETYFFVRICQVIKEQLQFINALIQCSTNVLKSITLNEKQQQLLKLSSKYLNL